MDITPENIRLIETGLRSEFNSGFAGVEPLYSRIATTVPSNGSGETYAWLKDIPGMREWIGDRRIRQLSQDGYRITNRLFESTISVKRTDIEDDQIGHYSTLARTMGDQAARHPDVLVFDGVELGFEARCYDGQNFFDADHPVGEDGQEESVSNFADGAEPAWYLLDTTRPLRPFIFQNRTRAEFETLEGGSEVAFMRDEHLYGTRARGEAGFGFWQLAYASKQPLTSANVIAARTAMEGFTNDFGEKLGVQPNILMVSSANRAAAETLIGAEKIDNAYNTLKGAFDLIVAPRLS